MSKRIAKVEKVSLIDVICERISSGETLRAICREKGMPAWRTVYDWLDADEEFATRFARAREIGFDAIAYETICIADTPLEGVEYEIGDDGKTKEKRSDMLGHRKLQIETRLKLLAKWSPQKYGERQHVEVSGKLTLESLVAGDD
jgi:hypothetical protein